MRKLLEKKERIEEKENALASVSSKKKMKHKRLLYYLILVMILVSPLIMSKWTLLAGANEPLHSTIEAIGTPIALGMALILRQRKRKEGGEKLFFISMGFISMGILDGFHAITSPGQAFVLLHSVAHLAGGLGFVLVCLPKSYSPTLKNKWIPWIVATVSILFGIWVLVSPETFPKMLQHNGKFTSTAININLLAGGLFLTATLYYVINFHHSGEDESYLFACMTLLFGLSGLTFKYSALWDSGWWLWHLLRLVAYLSILKTLIRGYNQMVYDLRTSLVEREQAQERSKHLNLVLRAIRNVNQLITQEKDHNRLLQGICDNLIETRGYHSAWIAIFDEPGEVVMSVEAGLGENFLLTKEQLEHGKLPHCAKNALERSKAWAVVDPSSTCKGCPSYKAYSKSSVLANRLEHNEKIYGVLVVSTDHLDEEEVSLFEEIANDIGFALSNLELEEEHKQVEKNLRESEERFKDITRSLSNWIWEIDKNGQYTFVSGKVEQTLGYIPEEFIGKSPFDFMPEEEATRVGKIFEPLAAKKETIVDLKNWNIAKNGKQVCLLTNGVPVLDENDELQGYRGSDKDITQREMAEEALRNSRAELEESNLMLQEKTATLEEHRHLDVSRTKFLSLLNSIESSFIADRSLRHLVDTTDSQLGLIYLSSAVNDELKLQASYSIDQSVIFADDFDTTAGLPAQVVESKEQIVINTIDSDVNFSFNLGFGKAVPKQIMGYPLSFRGKVLGAIILAGLHEYSVETRGFLSRSIGQLSVALNNAQSYTEVQRQSNRLKKMNKELVEHSRLKSEFLSNMSHELRTPLNSILGFSGIMLRNKKGNLTDRNWKNLERINRNGKSLLRLINEVLDLSKVEAGKMDVNRQPVDLKRLIETQMELIEPQAKEKGLSLSIEVNQQLPEIDTDSDKVEQILKNLLTNAIKFTKKGGITVKIEERAKREEPVEISVIDTGIGIPPEAQNVVFEEFRQADGSTTRQFGGTGLGLSICRKFANILGGEIKLESEEGVGSTFTFVLPIDDTSIETSSDRRDSSDTQNLSQSDQEIFSSAKEGPKSSDLSSQLSGLRQKAVLSIDDDPDVLVLMTEHITSFEAKSITATGGLEGLQKAQDLKPDMITLDLMMPEMDGWETLKALKADTTTRDIPVVIISILEQDKAVSFGVVDYLTKPLSREVLYDALNRILDSKMGVVMAVDDEPDFLTLIDDYLSGSVDKIITATNGKEALQKLENEIPDLILLDLMMPEMDGFEFLENVKVHQRYSHIPIVVITAKVLTDEEKNLLKKGTIRVIQKGKDTYEQLKQTFREVLAD